MPTNIEIKFRVDDLCAVEKKAVAIADSGPELLTQEDVFFYAPNGRLKLRKFADGSAELIGYQRIDEAEVRQSQWLAYSTVNSEALQQVLYMTLGQSVVVSKRRTLYLIGTTRVHLDRVDGLGDFVELEVVLREGESHSNGLTIAEDIVARLGLETAEKVAVAYADLLESPSRNSADELQ